MSHHLSYIDDVHSEEERKLIQEMQADLYQMPTGETPTHNEIATALQSNITVSNMFWFQLFTQSQWNFISQNMYTEKLMVSHNSPEMDFDTACSSHLNLLKWKKRGFKDAVFILWS